MVVFKSNSGYTYIIYTHLTENGYSVNTIHEAMVRWNKKQMT